MDTHHEATDLPERPVVRTQADLERTWRTLMQPLGFARASIWMMLLDADDRAVPHLTEIEDCDPPPDSEQLSGLADVAADLRDEFAPGGRWAFLRCRPGGAAVTADDRAWARLLLDACRARDLPTDVVHLATDIDVRPLPYDELARTA